VAEVVITVYGTPWPEGSLRAFQDRAGNVRVIHDNPKALQDWRDAVSGTARLKRAPALTGAVGIEMLLRLERPKGHWRTGRNAGLLRDSAPRWPGGARFDVDKLARAVLDSLAGILFANDAQVADLHARKLYADEHNAPGAVIRVRELETRQAR
jgi:Holliday junction resolvase RusA-like endonuclease